MDIIFSKTTRIHKENEIHKLICLYLLNMSNSQIHVGSTILGQTVSQDTRPAWFKVHNVKLGQSQQNVYKTMSDINLGHLLDNLVSDSKAMVVNYDTVKKIGYISSNFNLNDKTDCFTISNYMTFIKESNGPDGPPSGPPNFINRVPIALTGNMTDVQNDTILSLVSIAENDSTSWWNQYSYCEDIKDGRGFTAGFYGFCSGTGDMLMVFEALAKINPTHPLVKYIPALKQVNGTASHNGLTNLPQDCKTFNDTDYQKAQWEICSQLYWNPAMQFAQSNGLVLPITKGELYDTIINFGDLTTLAPHVKSKTPSQGGDEITWLQDFLNVKQQWITNVDKSLDSGQPDRCILWRNILNSGNTLLKRPLKNLTCYGDTFNIV